MRLDRISLLMMITTLCLTAESFANTVYLGDSQSRGTLGRLMYDFLSQNDIRENKTTQLFGVVSSSPRHWTARKNQSSNKWLCRQKGRMNRNTNVAMKSLCNRTRSGQSLANSIFKTNQASHVVFQFLGNSTGFSRSFLLKNIRQLLDDMGRNATCTFITSPPHYVTLRENNQKRIKTQEIFIEAIGHRCHIIAGVTDRTLREFATQRDYYARDRKHLSSKGARAFFEFIKARWQ